MRFSIFYASTLIIGSMPMGRIHRRRIKTEEKVKVVAAVWGTQDRSESIHCRASYFAYDDFEEKDEIILFFISYWCNSSYSLN